MAAKKRTTRKKKNHWEGMRERKPKEFKKVQRQIAGKLYAEGIRASTFTKKSAKRELSGTAARVYLKAIVDLSTVAEMKKLLKDIRNGK